MLSPEQLKGKIRDIAKEKGLSSQEILQMYLFERVIDRLSISEYRNNFILKGGFLISSMIGIEERTTMDIDTTVKGLSMEEEVIEITVKDILNIDIGDGICFEYERIEPIKETDHYNNFRVYFRAHFGRINNPMKMDITTGDVITPSAINYNYPTIMGKEKIRVLAYNLETILAEKYETIIRRNVGNTRARDLYDLYTLYTLYNDRINFSVLREAVKEAGRKRGSLNEINDWEMIVTEIAEEPSVGQLWSNYQKEYGYAGKVKFTDIIGVIQEISVLLNNKT